MAYGNNQVRSPIPALLLTLVALSVSAQSGMSTDAAQECAGTGAGPPCPEAARATGRDSTGNQTPMDPATPIDAPPDPETSADTATVQQGRGIEGTADSSTETAHEPAPALPPRAAEMTQSTAAAETKKQYHLEPTPLPVDAEDAEEIPASPMLPLQPQEIEGLTRAKPMEGPVLPEPQGPSAADIMPSPTAPMVGTTTGTTDMEAQTTIALPRLPDAVLYEDLPWDFCGPRAGRTGIGGLSPATEDQGLPVGVDADRADYDRRNDVITLDGDIAIIQGKQLLLADRAIYDRGTGEVAATGNLYVEQPGLRLIAGSGRYNLETKEGSLEDVGYRVAGDSNLRGTAREARLLAQRQTQYRDVIYTTCPPGHSDWSIRSSRLLLDHADGMGTAHHARIRIGDIPVFYTPWLRFPIDDRRRSGFLVPTIGSSDRTGTDISIPYYWNIAPNLDATFFPRYMSSRGPALGLELRHLASFQMLEMYGEVLPHDAEDEDQGTRWALKIDQTGQFGPGWTTAVDFNAVSDDRYLTDFGNNLDVTSVRNLSRRGDIFYTNDRFNLLFRAQDFQTVDPDIPAQFRPYAQLPHVELAIEPLEWQGTEWAFDTRYDYFAHDDKVHGNRVVALPSVRVPLRRSFGSLIPRARVVYTGYALQDEGEGVSPQQSHLVPSLDVDGKLIFERQSQWLGGTALQTLEPRLYYVYIPYEDQTDTPLFDTTELDFSFASLFRPNRFTGYDRIGDENRLTLGLTSRTLDDQTGDELFRVSLGQILYFDNRRVQLSGDTPDLDQSSSVAGEIAASIARDWSARASVQWNPHATQNPWEKRVLQLRYASGNERLLNLSYRFNLGQTEALRYEDTDLSFRLPVTRNVKVVGRWLYSMLNSDTVEAFAGIEFGRCCWRLRVLGRHLKTTSQDSGSTSVMLQLELAGLGAIGDSIDAFLERGIYGYETIH